MGAWLLCYWVPFSVSAQDHFSIHNHWVGEHIDQFLADDPGLRERVSECKSISDNPDAWVLKDSRYLPAQVTPSKHPNEKNVQLQLANSNLYQIVLDSIRADRHCDKVKGLFSARDEIFYDSDPEFQRALHPLANFASTRWFFTQGVLSKIEVTFRLDAFEDVVSDVNGRTKVLPKQRTMAMQNAFGAEWQDRSADWLTSEIHGELRQSNNPASQSLKLTVERRADYDGRIRMLETRPSPLD